MLRLQLEKANQSLKHYETVEKTNMELVQKVSVLEASVKYFIFGKKKKSHEILTFLFFLKSWQKESQKILII